MNIIQKNRRYMVVKALFVGLLVSAAGFVEAKRLAAPNRAVVNVLNGADFTYQEPLFLDTDRLPLVSFNKVAFLKDGHKHSFIIKCYADPEQAIHEALGAYVGASVGIRINKVRIIPPHVHCVGKDDGCVATIHTCVPGKEVCNIANICEKADIYGGLRCFAHLQSITENDELCSIVALDIYLDNYDRHQGNLFFDTQTAHFYAIDMDRVFSSVYWFNNNASASAITWDLKSISHLATDSYDFLVRLNSEQLSPKEVTALSHVRDWLNKLTDKYSANSLYDLWMKCAHDAVYTYSSVKKQYIRAIVDYNCCQVERVVAQLDVLVVA